MRLVQVTIPAGKREAVLSTLDEEGIDYVVTDEVSGREYTAVVTFPLPTGAVEPVLEHLREAGVERDAYTVVVAAETVASRKFEELVEEYTEDIDEDRIARQELLANARELAPSRRSYLLLTVISVVIATAGVLLDSAATVVGSMVIAPLIGPAMATSVGTVVGDRELFRKGFRLQALGFGAALVAATGFAFLVKTVGLIPPGIDVLAIGEVEERTAPGVLTLAIALGAGVAGARSLRAGVSASLVGVMIAVALVPPVAVVGIGIAWGLPAVAVGAAVLVLVNALSINLAALVTLYYAGYAPERLFAVERARSTTLRQATVLAVAILVLSAFLGGVTLNSYREATTERQVRAEVQEVLSAPAYADLEVIRIEVTFTPLDERLTDSPLRPRVERLVITVGRPNGETYPGLAAELSESVDAVETVEVRFVTVKRPGDEPSSRLRPATVGDPGQVPGRHHTPVTAGSA
ncbi:TIGR00341 family protein [Halobacteriales archaeon QS_8_69_26]|nr:MAG: TIGR00341 family protein [Halobacteriales archaeon QS_8_69_26]